MKSASPRRSVDATKPAVSTRAPRPNSTPFGLSKNTCPLACKRPSITELSVPTTRLSTTARTSGCTNSTLAPCPIEKPCQLMAARALVCVTVMVRPLCTTCAAPALTCAPVGRSAAASAAPACSSTLPSSAPLTPERLPRLREVSATAMATETPWRMFQRVRWMRFMGQEGQMRIHGFSPHALPNIQQKTHPTRPTFGSSCLS